MTEINDFKKILSLKKRNKAIVLCHGVFDLLHVGHLNYFREAKKLGDILVVSVTTDKYVNKGPLRPVFNIDQRINFLKNIKIIDFVFESKFPTSEKIIEKIQPNFYCKGPDYEKKNKVNENLKKEISAIKKCNGKFTIVKHETKSSSEIINQKNLDLKDDALSAYLKKIRQKYSFDFLKKEISKIKKLNVLVLGEIIIDKYIFAEAVGKSGKDSMLVFREKYDQEFLGGSGYIANLCTSFTKNINFPFYVGKEKNSLKFIKNNLDEKIKYKFFTKKDSPTIKKLRYLDYYKNTKIVGFYNINDDPLDQNEEIKFNREVKKQANKNDLIILADYGHGDITKLTRKTISGKRNKLFLNTQINAFNHGYHSLENYKKVNTLCMNETEIRYHLRDRRSNLDTLTKVLSKKISFRNLIITQGKFGSTLYHKEKKYFAPAFNLKPIDTIGSGDTFFTIISLCLSANLKQDLSLFFASLAASYSVNSLGNERFYKIKMLEENLKNLFYGI